ncbi:ribosomal protein S5 domain 2-like protein [Amylostereum chailletii]|nr:ribosomal protein S5 domain 2-like protein [Amylostereum chailletii]
MAQSTADRRRITGPEESSPQIFDDVPDATSWQLGDPRRTRERKDIRPIFLKTGLVSQANGSAYIETGRTKLACAVYGPRQSKSTSYHESGKLNVEVKFTPFSGQIRKAPLKDVEDRSISSLIHQALLPSIRLDLLPKSVIDIFVTVIECDGSEGCAAAGAVACSAALANAGVEMFGMIASMGDEIWLDPTDVESAAAIGSLLFTYMPALDAVTNVRQTGCMLPSQAVQAMKLCQERCKDIHQVVVQALLISAKTQ